MFFLIVAGTLDYIHRFFICRIGVRFDFFVDMPTLAFAMRYFTIFIFVRLDFTDNKRRVSGFKIMPKMREFFRFCFGGSHGIAFPYSALLSFRRAFARSAIVFLFTHITYARVGSPIRLALV